MSQRMEGTEGLLGQSSKRPSFYVGVATIGLSLFALAIVLGNLAAGAPPQPDENTWAHLFQLAMAAQVPLFLIFLVTADWSRVRQTTLLLCAQLCSAALAFGALWWSGY